MVGAACVRIPRQGTALQRRSRARRGERRGNAVPAAGYRCGTLAAAHVVCVGCCASCQPPEVHTETHPHMAKHKKEKKEKKEHKHKKEKKHKKEHKHKHRHKKHKRDRSSSSSSSAAVTAVERNVPWDGWCVQPQSRCRDLTFSSAR
eukprot:COSAG01_NODE_2020_length_8634_cov_4.835735_12_plen_147_part_00